MHKPESVWEYETYKILWDMEIKTDHLILARSSDFVVINKKKTTKNEWIDEENLFHCGFLRFRRKIKESEKREKMLDLDSE